MKNIIVSIFLLASTLWAGEQICIKPCESQKDFKHHQCQQIKKCKCIKYTTVLCDSAFVFPSKVCDTSITSIPKSDESWTISLEKLLDFIAKLAASLGWPLAVIIIVFLLRIQLTELLTRLRKGKIGNAEFEFAEDVRAVREESEIEQTPESQSVDPQTFAKASSDPRSVILTAWLEVEAALNILIETKKLAIGYTNIGRRPLSAFRLVQKANLLSDSYINLFHDLRTLRNDAAHSVDFSPPIDAVVQYTQLARVLAAELRRKAAV